ncbi:uracil-DNA glycosylase [Thermaerobacter litoralis]
MVSRCGPAPTGGPDLEEPWPEVPAPRGASCAQFGLEGHGRLVWGEGDPGARLWLVLDNPGAREDPAGRPWVCGTRRTLRQALWAAGLGDRLPFLTFLVKCRPRRAYDRQRAQRAGIGHLARQVADGQPLLLVLLGDVVVRAVLGDPHAAVRPLRGQRLRALGTPALVSYHPLAARRRPALFPRLVEDLAAARRWLAELESR